VIIMIEFFKKYKLMITFSIILLIGTIIFLIGGGKYDIAVTDMYYDASAPLGERWPLEHTEPWYFFNEYNDYFTYFMLITIVPPFLYSFVNKKQAWSKKHLLFAILSVALGAGLLVNEVFKGLWGRPRPRHTVYWPNSVNDPQYKWYHVWELAFLDNPDLIGEGVSFPSGHVSIVVALISYYYLFKNPKFWAIYTSNTTEGEKYERNLKIFTSFKYIGLVASLVLGALTGIGRIVVGAHHASDVLWAYGIVYIFTALCYYVFFKIPKHEEELLKYKLKN
jgi:membrane-associated phospholipid phosphatase